MSFSKFLSFVSIFLILTFFADPGLARPPRFRNAAKNKLVSALTCSVQFVKKNNTDLIEVTVFNISVKRNDELVKKIKIAPGEDKVLCNEVMQMLANAQIGNYWNIPCKNPTKIKFEDRKHDLCIPDLNKNPDFKNFTKQVKRLNKKGAK